MPGVNLLGSTAQLQKSLNTIISRFDVLRDDSGVMRPLMTELDLAAHTGRSYVRTNYGRVLAKPLTDGVDMVQQQDLSDAQTTYTPNEVGVQVVLAKTTIRRSADKDLEGRTAGIMERAYSLKEDQDCCAIAASYTNSLGSSSTVLGIGHITGAQARLAVGNSLTTPEPYDDGETYFVAHPCSLHAVAMRMVPLTDVPVGTNVYATTSAGATVGPGRDGPRSDELIQKGFRALVDGRIGTALVKKDANVAATAANTGANSLFFNREGAVFCSEFEPEMDPEPDSSLRGIEMNMVGSYAVGVYRPGASGIEMIFDCTLPTA